MANAALVGIEARHQVLLEQLKSGKVRDFMPIFTQVENLIQDALRALRVDKLNEIDRPALEQMLTTLSESQSELFSQAIDGFIGSVPSIAKYEAEFEARAIRSAMASEERSKIGIPSAKLVATEAMRRPVQATGHVLKDFFGDWSKSAVTRTNKAVRIGYEQGQTVPQILKGLFGSKPLRFKDAQMEVTKKQAATVVRTAVQQVASTARQITYEENADVIDGYEWLSTLDSKTTPQCRALDGRKFKVGQGPLPPIHPNCRSTTVPTLSHEFDFLDKGSTRSSAAGYVDADLSYYDWLQTQSTEFQDHVLGPTRATLFRDGGLTPDQFGKLQLDKNFDPITLDKMRELEPLAFARAGLSGGLDEERDLISWGPSMTPNDVKFWSSNSVIKEPLFHTTSKQVANQIKLDGFRPSDSGLGKEWGQGVYLSRDKKTSAFWEGELRQKGVKPETLSIAVNIQRPFVIDLPRNTAVAGFDPQLIVAKKLGKEEEFRALKEKIVKQNLASYGKPDVPFINNPGAEAITQLLKKDGYDSLIVNEAVFSEGVGGNQVIVFDAENVTVINAKAASKEPKPVPVASAFNPLKLSGRPGPNTTTGRVWQLGDDLYTKLGRLPSRQEMLAGAKDLSINDSTVSVQFAKWKKAYNDVLLGPQNPILSIPPVTVQKAVQAVTELVKTVESIAPVVSSKEATWEAVKSALDSLVSDLKSTTSTTLSTKAKALKPTMRYLYKTYGDGEGGIDIVRLKSTSTKDYFLYRDTLDVFKTELGEDVSLALETSNNPDRGRKAVHDLLAKFAGAQKELVITDISSLTKDVRSKAQQAIDFLNRVTVDKYKTGSLDLRVNSLPGQGSSYNRPLRLVNIRNNAQLTTYVHEIGHHFEYESKNLPQLVDFIEKRQKGEKRHSMPGMEKAMIFDDEWVKRGGQTYTSRLYPGAPGQWRSSEVLSTGVERLFTNPVEFYLKDPEHFTVVVKTLLNLW